jgi:hypothetical protein
MKRYFVLGKLLILGLTISSCHEKSKHQKIIAAFENWKEMQISIGNYQVKNSEMGQGIPDEIDVFYTDINQDEIIDGIICFNPILYGGGNALMNAQEKLMIISKNENYEIDNTSLSNLERKLKSGWIHLTHANNGVISGDYYDYKSNDGRCCPSKHKQLEISIKNKKAALIFKR